MPEGPRRSRSAPRASRRSEYLALWRATFRPGAIFLTEVTLRRDLGNRILAFARGEVRVDDLRSRLSVPLAGARAPRARRALRSRRGAPRPGLRARRRSGARGAGRDAHGVSRVGRRTGAGVRARSPRREGYRRLLAGVAEVEHGGAAPRRISAAALPPPPGAPDAGASRKTSRRIADRARLDVVRRRERSEQRSSFQVLKRSGGRVARCADATLAGPREDLLRNDSLRGRLAGTPRRRPARLVAARLSRAEPR